MCDDERMPVWIHRLALVFGFWGLFACSAPALGIQQLTLGIGSVAHPLFSADDLTLELGLGSADAAPSGTIRVGSVGNDIHRAGPLAVHCQSLQLRGSLVHCREARVNLAGMGLPGILLRGEILHDRSDHAMQVRLSGDAADDGISLRVDWSPEAGGELQLSLPDLPLRTLQQAGYLDDWLLDGAVSVNATITLDPGMTAHGTVVLTLAGATIASADGRLATENLDATVVLGMRGSGTEQRGTLRLRARKGLAYVDPVLLDLDRHPTDLVAAVLHRDGRTWLEQLRLQQPGLLRGRGNARMDWAAAQPLQQLNLRITNLYLPDGYDTYLQPFLIGTLFDRLDMSGDMSGELSLRQGEVEAGHVALDRVSVDDQRERFTMAELDGALYWTADAGAPPSRLRWAEAGFYRLGLGPTELDFQLHGNSMRLRRPVGVPVEDGRLQLDHLDVAGMRTGDLQATLEGRLEPISLRPLSRSLGWPPLRGTLSGTIPRVTYRDRRLSLDGALQADVFDGRVTIPRLRINEPMGRFPQLHTDIRLRALDLEQVSGAFALGRITGRLHGDIIGLELVNWEPVAFDAHLYSAPGSPGPRRISQRAIENIADLGGGGRAVVAAPLLRIFDDFRYRQLGIRCRLRDEVCRMSGVEPADGGGFFLVRGAGVPRVDVIGFSREVDWPTLLEQLRAVMQ